ncbi:MAG: glucose 1-dehydrogenase [bacterium]|nr:glucose 1-dehydrogenase [bacterium]
MMRQDDHQAPCGGHKAGPPSTRRDPGAAMELDGRVILVTGARRGIGYAIAARAGAAGATVILHARERAQAEAAVVSLPGRATVIPVGGDLASVSEIRRMLEAAGAAAGHLDGLVNNAGVAVVGPSAQLAESDWDRQFDVNVKAAFFSSQAALPLLLRGTEPSVVNVSSLHAETAIPGRAAYAASKAALSHLTRALAVEWAPLGIRVNAVAPGYVRTEQISGLLARNGARLEARTPLGRLAEPEDIAEAVCFLLCPAARQVTGVVLRVDGGWVPYGGWDTEGDRAPVSPP